MSILRSLKWYVYLLKCFDGTFYCGMTMDLGARVQLHNEGKAAKYTRGRGPVKLIARSFKLPSRNIALQEEARIKKLPKDKKLSAVQECGREYIIRTKKMKLEQRAIRGG